ncbi:hypothetical protein NUU61_007797 [Penicillium alfredii]|uniref:Uncharacterized protein n=1 Tax=Penicillium alfredii TaxID=1506179 RepID=A0A9W9JYS9_9EURO|nr:uncharacterized protein NUU61_007797 [Penicillium alfredii]KAJ5086490.1 hypothetical protein NUU61_007797 [Penicillium alfredii]
MERHLLKRLADLIAYNKRGIAMRQGKGFLAKAQKARVDRQLVKLKSKLQPELANSSEKLTLEKLQKASHTATVKCPLSRIFTSKRISSLEDEEVERLAAESSATLEERARLTSEMEMLQVDYEELRTIMRFEYGTKIALF